MTTAPVTAPVTKPESLHSRRRTAAALIIHSMTCTGTCNGPVTDDYDKADKLIAAHAEIGDTALTTWVDERSAGNVVTAWRKAAELFDVDQTTYRTHLLTVHEYDFLIFGGSFCTACTPGGECEPEQVVGWPCTPLREAGLTNEMAEHHIQAEERERDRVRRRVREAKLAGQATLPELAGFREHGGIRVGYVGDHGDLYALGWHLRPMDVLGAMDAHAREVAGIDGVWDSPDRNPEPNDLRRAWAINIGAGDQWRLETVSGDAGGAPVYVTCDDPGAFPVTILWA